LLIILASLKSQIGFANDNYLRSQGYFDGQNLSERFPSYVDKDYPSEVNKIFLDMEQSRKIFLENTKQEYKKMFYEDLIYTGLFALIAILLVNTLLFTRIELNDEKMNIFFPLSAVLGFFARPFKININDIKTINVNRTTPFGPDLKDFDKMNWRDNLVINGLLLKGYVFSSLGRVYQYIIKQKPDIRPDYYKNTVSDNLQKD